MDYIPRLLLADKNSYFTGHVLLSSLFRPTTNINTMVSVDIANPLDG
jgi:hypothetical protein